MFIYAIRNNVNCHKWAEFLLSMFPEIVSLGLSVMKILVRACREEIFRRIFVVLVLFFLAFEIHLVADTKRVHFHFVFDVEFMCFRNFG